jgi:hypothetical protein
MRVRVILGREPLVLAARLGRAFTFFLGQRQVVLDACGCMSSISTAAGIDRTRRR